MVHINMAAVRPKMQDQGVLAATAWMGDYYLGIAHYWVPVPGKKDGRKYTHFFYRMEAEPPFRILQVGLGLGDLEGCREARGNRQGCYYLARAHNWVSVSGNKDK